MDEPSDNDYLVLFLRASGMKPQGGSENMNDSYHYEVRRNGKLLGKSDVLHNELHPCWPFLKLPFKAEDVATFDFCVNSKTVATLSNISASTLIEASQTYRQDQSRIADKKPSFVVNHAEMNAKIQIYVYNVLQPHDKHTAPIRTTPVVEAHSGKKHEQEKEETAFKEEKQDDTVETVENETKEVINHETVDTTAIEEEEDLGNSDGKPAESNESVAEAATLGVTTPKVDKPVDSAKEDEKEDATIEKTELKSEEKSVEKVASDDPGVQAENATGDGNAEEIQTKSEVEALTVIEKADAGDVDKLSNEEKSVACRSEENKDASDKSITEEKDSVATIAPTEEMNKVEEPNSAALEKPAEKSVTGKVEDSITETVTLKCEEDKNASNKPITEEKDNTTNTPKVENEVETVEEFDIKIVDSNLDDKEKKKVEETREKTHNVPDATADVATNDEEGEKDGEKASETRELKDSKESELENPFVAEEEAEDGTSEIETEGKEAEEELVSSAIEMDGEDNEKDTAKYCAGEVETEPNADVIPLDLEPSNENPVVGEDQATNDVELEDVPKQDNETDPIEKAIEPAVKVVEEIGDNTAMEGADPIVAADIEVISPDNKEKVLISQATDKAYVSYSTMHPKVDAAAAKIDEALVEGPLVQETGEKKEVESPTATTEENAISKPSEDEDKEIIEEKCEFETLEESVLTAVECMVNFQQQTEALELKWEKRETMITELQTKQTQQTSQIEALSEDKAHLEVVLKEARSEKTELKSQLKEMERELTSSKQEKGLLQQGEVYSNYQMTRYEMALDKLTNTVNGMKEENQVLQQEKVLLKEETAHLTSKVEAFERWQNKFKSVMEQKQQLLGRLEEQTEEYQSQIQHLQKEVESLKASAEEESTEAMGKEDEATFFQVVG